jgi:hypothetical protein
MALLVMTMLVMLVMLYFGIRMKGVSSGNNVRWSDSGVGLVFDRYAVAYTDGFFSSNSSGTACGLTIELAIEPIILKHSSFSFILLVHDGVDERQLVIGQWRSSLLVMNGSDYSNKRRVPKIYVPLGEGAPQLISIVSNESGTRVFINGVLRITKGDLVLHFPKGGDRARLVVGNSLNGSNPWMGRFLGLAMNDHALADEIIQQHFNRWHSDKKFNGLQSDKPRLLYSFDEGQGGRVFNRAGNDLNLIIPSELEILDKEVLSWPHLGGIATPRMMEDVLINLIGFIPLGFLLIATLSRIKGVGVRAGMIVALLIAFSFSLCIEVAQVWIPTRDSSMLDLVLNTIGAGAGVLLFQWGRKSRLFEMAFTK